MIVTKRTQGNHQRLRALSTTIGLLTLSLIMAACSSSNSGSKAVAAAGVTTPSNGVIKLRMALAPSLASLPEYVALKQGMFTKQNLEVSISSSADVTNLPAALGRQYDFGVGLQNVLISAVASGLPLVATGGGQLETPTNPNSGVIVKGTSGIKGPKDFVGKNVGVASVNGAMGLEFLWWLHNNGVDETKVHLVQVAFSNMADQLKAGRVDAVFPLVPFVSAVLAGVPGSVNLGDAALSVGNGVATQGSFLMSDKSWAAKNASVVCGVEKAATEAIAFIKDKPDEAKQILSDYSHIPLPVLKDLNLGEFRAYETSDDLGLWLNVMKTVGSFDGAVVVKDLVTASCVSPS